MSVFLNNFGPFMFCPNIAANVSPTMTKVQAEITTGRENSNAVMRHPRSKKVAPLRFVNSLLLRNEPKKRMKPSLTPFTWRRIKSIATMTIVTMRSKDLADTWGRR